jgi:exopolyphosphatase/guanosine-5'-triphosphate,3'-diphosphate pyrophosphatase
MDLNEINLVFDKIINTNSSERKDIPGMSKDRADIIVGGIMPLKVLIKYAGASKLIISGNGIREGAFFKYYFYKYKINEKIVANVLQHNIDNILLRYDVDIQHSYLIRKLSIDLYDSLISLHKLDDSYRKLLKVSALLHDIGLHVDYYNHHYHGFYLTLNSRINGLNFKELVICAFVVGMHRNEDLKQEWTDYQPVINSDDYEAIQILSLFVRISEELCKTQNGNIKELKCIKTKNSVNIIIEGNSSNQYIPALLQCEKAFKKLFDKNLVLQQSN